MRWEGNLESKSRIIARNGRRIRLCGIFCKKGKLRRILRSFMGTSPTLQSIFSNIGFKIGLRCMGLL